MARRRSPGFTLIELMLAVVIIGFVLVGAVLALRSQQRAYASGQWIREAQDASRRATLALEQRVRHAGLGVDPAFALDFNIYGSPLDPYRDASLCPAEMAGCARDATQNDDELVFYVRDPAFLTQDPQPVGHAWPLTAVTAASATITTKPGDTFRMGQILLAACRDPNHYTYFTVAANASNATGTGTPPSALQLRLEPVNVQSPFRRQDVATGSAAYVANGVAFPAIDADGCFASGYVYKVDRYRFHVRPVMGDTRYEPYLVLDMGIDRNGDGRVNSDDELLVARGVEVFQVSYLLPNGMVAGETPAQAIQFADANPLTTSFGTTVTNTITRTLFPFKPPTLDRSTYYAASWFHYPSSDAVRQLNAQGNIRAVRIGLVARSQSPDPERPTNFAIGAGFQLFNFSASTAVPAWLATGRPASGDDRFARVRTEITIPLPNMGARGISL